MTTPFHESKCTPPHLRPQHPTRQHAVLCRSFSSLAIQSGLPSDSLLTPVPASIATALTKTQSSRETDPGQALPHMFPTTSSYPLIIFALADMRHACGPHLPSLVRLRVVSHPSPPQSSLATGGTHLPFRARCQPATSCPGDPPRRMPCRILLREVSQTVPRRLVDKSGAAETSTGFH